jgi:hypothetical protein
VSTRAALAGCVVFVALAGATAAAATTKVIGQGTHLKGTKIWYAHGNATFPKTVSASIVPSPAQPVKVQWALVCQRPNPQDPAIHLAAQSTSGTAAVRGRATVKLALPYAKPHNCVATVYATLAKAGSLTVRLLQT